MTPAQIAAECELTDGQVSEALAFHKTHKEEIDQAIQAEAALEQASA